MSRKNAREIALHLIFGMTFQNSDPADAIAERLDQNIMESISRDMELYAGKLDENDIAYITNTVKGVYANQNELDAIISAHSHGWSISRLSRMTVSILRLALYEIQSVDDVPVGAAINEAVELAKTYESVEAGSFINGILGTVNRMQEDLEKTSENEHE